MTRGRARPAGPARLALVLALGIVAGLTGACGPGAEALATASDARFAEGEEAYARGEYARAAELYFAAAASAQQADDAGRERAARAQAAVALKMDGETARARPILLAVLDEARAAGDARTEGLALGNLAKLEILEDRLPQARARLDELADFAREHDDALLEVKTLEQAIASSLELGDDDGALARVERALARDAELDEAESREDSLIGQRAAALARRGDDEGAQALWIGRGASAAALANRARHLATLGLHEKASELAREAAHLFERDGRGPERDRAILLRLDQLVAAGRVDEADAALTEFLAIDETAGAARAPFEVLRARARLLAGRPREALPDLLAARADVEGGDRVRVDRLLVLAHGLADDVEAADAVLAGLPEDRARGLLSAWLQLDRGDERTLASEAAAGLRLERWDPSDGSLAELRALAGPLLPSAAWLALDLHLADAERLRRLGRDELARDYVRYGIVEALLWQAVEAHEALPVVGTSADLAGIGATLERWTRGELPEDVAVGVLVPGAVASYWVVLTSEGPATIGSAPRAALVAASWDAMAVLRAGGDVVPACARLYEVLLGEAGALLGTRRRWTLVLPDALLGVPPAMWVSDEATGRWLVLDHDVSLLPCVPARAPRPLALTPWTLLDAPALEPWRFPIASETHRARFGETAFETARVELPVATAHVSGADATVAALRALAPEGVLHLALPGFGGGRLGGLALAPDEHAAFVDESGGWLPWHRAAGLVLPPTVIAEATRFDPTHALEAEAGAGTAALCLMQSADRVLLRRWPVPAPAQAEILARVVAALGEGEDLGAAIAQAQRGALQAAPGVPPRLWAPWLAFEAP